MAGKKKATHGGKREGSGRPSTLKDPVNKLVALEKDMITEIEAKGHKVPQFLREAAARRLKEGW